MHKENSQQWNLGNVTSLNGSVNRRLQAMLFILILQCCTHAQLKLREKLGAESTQK